MCSGLLGAQPVGDAGNGELRAVVVAELTSPRRSVIVPPGATPLTRISGPSSTASWRISPTTACFEAV